MGIRKHWAVKALGFSLLELMVVVAILGILATVAVPRFNIFRARSRQSEAKTNLGVIFTLQESFAIEQETYYDGDKAKWGGEDMKDKATRDGYKGGGTNTCDNNKLGFRLANCDKARYGYFMNGAGENGFIAIAYAASDQAGDKRVFPGCDGTGAGRHALATAPTGFTASTVCAVNLGSTTRGAARTASNDTFATGDAWCMDEARRLYNYRDITEYCD